MNQYIITIELWRGGKCFGWDQAALQVCKEVKAIDLLEEIREKFKSESFVVKVTDIFKL